MEAQCEQIGRWRGWGGRRGGGGGDNAGVSFPNKSVFRQIYLACFLTVAVSNARRVM